MDVQYQLRMCGEGVMVSAGASGRASYPISTKHTHNNIMTPTSNYTESMVSPPGMADYWKMPTPQVQNEILKHEVQQSKVTHPLDQYVQFVRARTSAMQAVYYV